MSKVRASVVLDIDETDEERLRSNAEQFLRQVLIEKAPSEEIEDNAVRDKPTINIEEPSRKDEDEICEIGKEVKLEPAAQVLNKENGVPACDILVDYYTDLKTSSLEDGDKLIPQKNIHLWMAELKKAMDFDSREEGEGARKLVERAGLELGTHGSQILKKELEDNDSEGDA